MNPITHLAPNPLIMIKLHRHGCMTTLNVATASTSTYEQLTTFLHQINQLAIGTQDASALDFIFFIHGFYFQF